MVVTMLEAEVAEGHAAELTEAFRAGGGSFPSVIRESFLLHVADSELWRIVTVRESSEALDGYRRSVETPGGVLMFRAVGAEPNLKVFEVGAHADHN